MITPFGFIYFIVLIICFIRSFRAMAFLYLVSYLFQATAVVYVGSLGLPPYVIAPLFLFFRGAISRMKEKSSSVEMEEPFYESQYVGGINNIQKISIAFIAYVIIQALFSTMYFSDISVYPMGAGMETSLASRKVHLVFSGKNIIQWLYLILNMGGMIVLLRFKKNLNRDLSRNVLLFSLIFVLALGFWRYVTVNYGGWFPETFFFNNSSYDMENIAQSLDGRIRFTSVFVEASVCGLALAAFWWAAFFFNYKIKTLLLGICFICLLLTFSSTGFFSFGLGFFFYLIYKKSIKLAVGILLLLFLMSFIFDPLEYQNLFHSTIIDKSKSDSYFVRTAVMKYNWELFLSTVGIGCGLGSSLSSSLFLSLLSQIGVVGTLLFGAYLFFCIKFVKNYGTGDLLLPLCVVIFGQIISIGSISYPIFWMVLGLMLCSDRSEASCA